MPEAPSSWLGTGNVHRRPVAISMGGGFSETFEETREAVEKACGPSGTGCVWLKNDTTKPGPDVLGAGYAQTVADRVRATMDGLKKKGKVGTGDTGVYMY